MIRLEVERGELPGSFMAVALRGEVMVSPRLEALDSTAPTLEQLLRPLRLAMYLCQGRVWVQESRRVGVSFQGPFSVDASRLRDLHATLTERLLVRAQGPAQQQQQLRSLEEALMAGCLSVRALPTSERLAVLCFAACVPDSHRRSGDVMRVWKANELFPSALPSFLRLPALAARFLLQRWEGAVPTQRRAGVVHAQEWLADSQRHVACLLLTVAMLAHAHSSPDSHAADDDSDGDGEDTAAADGTRIQPPWLPTSVTAAELTLDLDALTALSAWQARLFLRVCLSQFQLILFQR